MYIRLSIETVIVGSIYFLRWICFGEEIISKCIKLTLQRAVTEKRDVPDDATKAFMTS